MRTLSLPTVFLFLCVCLLLFPGCKDDCSENPCDKPECHVECCGGVDCCSIDPCGYPEICGPQCCYDDPCGNPDKCPGACPAIGGGDDLDSTRFVLPERENWVIQSSPDGGETWSGSGEVIINTGCGDPLRLPLSGAHIDFGPDGMFRGLNGELNYTTNACLPPAGAALIGLPEGNVYVDVFYQPGSFVEDNYHLAFPLDRDRHYFIMGMRIDGTFGICNPLEDVILDQPRFSADGQVLRLFDPCTKLKYVDARSSVAGGFATGSSKEGELTFIPNYPQLGEIERIDGRSLKYGTHSVKRVLKLEGTLIRAKTYGVEIHKEDLLESDLSLGYAAGFNGSGKLGLVLFEIPLVAGSASIKAQAGIQESYLRVFLRGESAPFGEWWPDFMPVRPIAETELNGFYATDVDTLEIYQRTKFGLSLPSDEGKAEYSLEGEGRITMHTFGLRGNLRANEVDWTVLTLSEKEQTVVSFPLPAAFVNDYERAICDYADNRIQEANRFYRDRYLPDSLSFELALDLDGLRAEIPVITRAARNTIDRELAQARSDCRGKLPDIACSGGAFCDLPNPCDAYINAKVVPEINSYRRILDELDAATSRDLSDNAARAAIKAALQKLIDREVLNFGSARVGVCTKAVVCADYGIKVTVPARTKRVLTAEQVALLRKAHANVDRIPDEPYPVTAEEYGQILAALGTAPSACDGGTITDPGATVVGVVIPHGDGEATFYYETANGDRVTTPAFDPLDPLSFFGLFN